jgi:glycosyltransferase involved in cell wall biosynthesis
MARVVFVHDWLTGMRGGEKCLARMAGQFPEAPIATLFHERGRVSPEIESHPILTSPLQKLPGHARYYRYLLPIFPLAARWRIPPCDLLISLSHCVAKAAAPPPGVPHVCYCFTPMRYAWHMKDQYFGTRRSIAGSVRDGILARLRDWDCRTSDRVTHFVAISETVRRRIAECYDRDSIVIYPPVDTDFYTPAAMPREDFYLVVSAFAPYKRLDLAVEACTRLNRKLVVIGTGQDEGRLKAMAGPNVRFLGWQSDEVIRDHFRKCRALLFPGEEDFGIVPVEAQACGAPVIAFAQGGAGESVTAETGVLFPDQSVNGLIEAIERFEAGPSVKPSACRRNAMRFSSDRFDEEIRRYLQSVLGRTSRLAA